MNQNQPTYAFPDLGLPDDPAAPHGASHGWKMDKARSDNLTTVLPTVGFSALPDSSGVAHPSQIRGQFKLKKNVRMPPAPGKKGGRTRKRLQRRRNTRKAVPWRGWAKQAPSQKQRTKMLKNCGEKCFLGPKKSFPICRKNTCKVSSKGLWAAYVRSKEWGKPKRSYKGRSRPTMKRHTYSRVAKRSANMLRRRGFKVGISRK